MNKMKAFFQMNGSKMMAILGLMMFLVAVPVQMEGQTPKIQSLSEIESEVADASSSLGNMAKYIIGAVLLIALIGVIYMVASSHPKSKEAVIGWIAAVIVYIIAITII